MSKGLKKCVRVVGNIVLYVFLAVCIIGVLITLFSDKSDDGAVELFGYQMRVVVSDSMAACEDTDVSAFEIKSIPLRSMVFIQNVPSESEAAAEWYSGLNVGDVLTFRYVYANQVTITHRVVAITEKDGGYIIELAGDNKRSESEQLYQTIDTSVQNNTNYVIGKVTGQSLLLGTFVSVLQTPIGIVLVITVPCFIIILLEIIKIVGIVGDERRKREREAAEKDDELERLRRRLNELESQDVSESEEEKNEEDV